MKTLFVFILILFGVSQELKCQIVIRQNALDPVKPDVDTLININGREVIFEFDTLYFINQIFIRDYKNLQASYEELYQASGDLIDYMTSFNKDLKQDFSILNDNMERSYKLISDSLKANNVRLDRWKDENSRLISINNELSVNLTQAREQIKGEKWNSMGKKLLYGAGGLVVGIGVTSLIYSIAK